MLIKKQREMTLVTREGKDEWHFHTVFVPVPVPVPVLSPGPASRGRGGGISRERELRVPLLLPGELHSCMSCCMCRDSPVLIFQTRGRGWSGTREVTGSLLEVDLNLWDSAQSGLFLEVENMET